MLIEGLVIIGKAPIITIPANIGGVTIRNNHFIEWQSLSWWKRLFLRAAGIHQIRGRGICF